MFTREDFTVGDFIQLKEEYNDPSIFNKDFYSSEGFYEIGYIYESVDAFNVYGTYVDFTFDKVERVKLKRCKPWYKVGDYVKLKSRQELKKVKTGYVVGSMLKFANKTLRIKRTNVYYDNLNCEVIQSFVLETDDNIEWYWTKEAFVESKPAIPKPEYSTFSELVKFVSEPVQVVRCKNCRYWHPEIPSSISKAMCLCEMNSPKYPKTDYGYFTTEKDFCRQGSPDPNRDYGSGKLSEIDPDFTEE